ncbi:MAG: hypothetical protein WBQ94_22880 [Terracidiphilus sp.]
MSIGVSADTASLLEQNAAELRSIARASESDVESIVKDFEDLAADADTLMSLTATIVGSVEDDNVRSVLPKVQSLGVAGRVFIEERMQATAGILGTVAAEVALLHQLSAITRRQASIALKIKALSVLTKIEAARLGVKGTGFQYLACELADFSDSLTKDTQDLASHTNTRLAGIETTKCTLVADLPRMQKELGRIDTQLGSHLVAMDASFARFSSTPMRFKSCVEDVATQIAGVVAAIQAHDITRQQLEHVEQALRLVAGQIRDAEASSSAATRQLPIAHAGLTIQSYQVNSIKLTLSNWMSKIRTCMTGILDVSVSEISGISSLVLEQEREVSSKLGHIENLEQESQAYSEKMRTTLAGLSDLLELVGEHVQKSKKILNRLHLLSLNSMIEASSLGTQADTILAIAKNIVELSAEWSENTDQSGNAMQEIANHVNHTNTVMEALSEGNSSKLHESQEETKKGLENLRTAAAFAARQTQHIEAASEKMRARIAQVSRADDHLDAGFGRIDAVLSQIEGINRQLQLDYPSVVEGFDPAEVEQLFSASYSTEIERDVLRAALHGTALPTAQETFAGNSIELF